MTKTRPLPFNPDEAELINWILINHLATSQPGPTGRMFQLTAFGQEVVVLLFAMLDDQRQRRLCLTAANLATGKSIEDLMAEES